MNSKRGGMPSVMPCPKTAELATNGTRFCCNALHDVGTVVETACGGKGFLVGSTGAVCGTRRSQVPTEGFTANEAPTRGVGPGAAATCAVRSAAWASAAALGGASEATPGAVDKVSARGRGANHVPTEGLSAKDMWPLGDNSAVPAEAATMTIGSVVASTFPGAATGICSGALDMSASHVPTDGLRANLQCGSEAAGIGGDSNGTSNAV
mmetsp:Transcript_113691/g.328286  ORF Transcript_113691/g.328286 Transcript_113691/m.328286 type:complete len:209 (-) Transcript_113691:717-1343(-)